MGQFAPQLRALLVKNWILWKRNIVGSLLEIIIPVAFALILYAFRELVPPEDVAETSFLDKAYNFYPNNQSIPPLSSLVGGIQVTNTYSSNLPFLMRPCFARDFSIGLSPQNEFTQTLAGYLTPWNYTVKYFDTQQQIKDYVTDSNYGKAGARLCFAVSFLQATAGNYEYAITFNTSRGGDWGQDIPQTEEDAITNLLFQDQDTIKNYSRSGFLQVQNWLDNMILQKETNSSSASINASVASIHLPATTQDDLPSTLSGFLPFFVVMPMIIPFLRLLHMLLSEKENRMKETMKMMGMTNTSFYLSWVIYGAIVYLFFAFIWAGAIKATFQLSNYGLLFLWIYLYLLTLIPLALFINVFFDRAKMGVIGGLIFYFVLYFLSSQISANSSSGTLAIASLAPQIAVSISASQILVFEGFQYGLTSESINFVYQNYTIATAFGMFVVDFVILIVLAIYLDQVVPTEYGVAKPVFFCCKRKSRTIHDSQEDLENPNKNDDPNPDVEEVDHTLKAQEKNGDYININHLVKRYDSGKVAVNDLSMKMYKGQIFALLGHNGAGKTTTISIMSGLYPPTSGTIEILGKDIETDMEDIHQFMGVCPQHNVLYEQLTIKEHLELFGTFKGVPSEELDEEVTRMIVDTDLVEKKDYLAGEVSGGQKRKLSVGMAFIGGSKFIVLDEPSSGMDTAARRKMWEMLKNYKHGRVVIITTHFMDEADYLGDRIAIMAEGKLKCAGRSLFLKSKYGVGYNLTIVKKTADESKGIEEFIKNVIPSAKVVSDVSVEISIQLPMETSNQFKDLFEDLDRNKDKLNIDSYGIAVTTLEEVFLKVAADKAHEEAENKAKLESKEQPPISIEHVKLDHIQRITSETDLFFTHLYMMILKRIWYLKRDVKGLLCEIFIPILFVIIGLLLMGISFGNSQPTLTIEPSMYPQPILSYYGSASTTNSIPNNFITSGFKNGSEYNLQALSSSSLAAFDLDVYERRQITPYRLGAFYFTTYNPSTFTYNYLAEVNTSAPVSSTFFLNQVNNAILRSATNNPSASIKLLNSPFPMTQEEKSLFTSASGIVGVFVFGLAMAPIPASIISYIVREREQNIKHQQIVSGVSLLAYWLGNFIVDFMKHLIPAIVSALLAKAFSIDALTVDDCYGMTWLLFILYGTAVISYSYLASFIFKDYGSAQTTIFLVGFLGGFLGTVIIVILRVIPSTRDVGKGLGFLLRLLPNFSFCYGLMNMANRSLYQFTDKLDSLPDAFSWEVSNFDMLYLILETFIYMFFVIMIEVWRVKPACFSWFTGEQSVPYRDIKYDDDVQREEDRLMHADPKSMAVCVKKLRQVYNLGPGKHKVAVENVSFGLQKGECFALLGVNGAGKTSTFRILSGEYTQTEGQAFINGYDTLTDMRQIRPYIGYCPQFDALLDNLTSKEHLLIYAAIKGIPPEYREALVEKKLQEMDLKKFENIPAGTYSGGNKRKLSVAIALIGNPAIVLLDEPSSGMDPGARRFMWDVISNITTTTKDSSIILTTHAMDEAEALSTKLAIMVDGTFKCMGSTQHIKNKFGKGYELEIKVKSPEEREVNDFLKQLNFKPKSKLQLNEVKEMFKKANKETLIQTLTPEGAGAAIYTEIEQYGNVSAETPASYLLVDHKSKKVFDFLERNFGKYVLIEHIDTFFKFKIDIPEGLGKTFGIIEENKVTLEISQYSLKQTSIEQIFNMFAMHKEEAFLKEIGKGHAETPQQHGNQQQQQQQKKAKKNNQSPQFPV